MILVMKQSFIMVSYHIDWVSVFIIRRSIKVLLAHNSEMWKRQALRTVECVISHHWFIAGSQKERKNLIKVIDKRPQSQYLQRNCELKKKWKKMKLWLKRTMGDERHISAIAGTSARLGFKQNFVEQKNTHERSINCGKVIFFVLPKRKKKTESIW